VIVKNDVRIFRQPLNAAELRQGSGKWSFRSLLIQIVSPI